MNMTDEARRVAGLLDKSIGGGIDIARLLRTLAAEVDRLEAVVARLPKTADGVPLVDGDRVWVPDGTEYIYSHPIDTDLLYYRTECGVGLFASACYSTRDAALDAKEADHE